MRLRLGLVIGALAVATAAQAQTSSTNTARIDGTANCRRLTVSVNQQSQNGGTTTTLAYAVLECPSGGSEPTQVVRQGYQQIPNADYRVQQQAHSLNTQTVHGAITLNWRATTELQNTFNGTWTERQRSNVVTTREEQFHSTATVDGRVLGYDTRGGERPGWISTIQQRKQ